MRIENNDSVSAKVSVNNNSSNQTATLVKKVSTVESDKASNNATQKTNKDWPSSMSKSISQLNEYDMDKMPVSEKVVIEAIQKANKAISGGDRRFEFSIHEQTNEIVVKVFNSETNELIREIPNEKILDMVAKICEMAGLFVDERR